MTTTVQEGQIWLERDKRKTRYVKVLCCPSGWVRIRTCDEAGNLVRGTRVSLVDPARFIKAFSITIR